MLQSYETFRTLASKCEVLDARNAQLVRENEGL